MEIWKQLGNKGTVAYCKKYSLGSLERLAIA